MTFTEVASPPLSILIAEPYLDGAETLACVLRLYGHDVAIARNGCEAVAAAAESPPDVLIVEPRLPGMDGWELARRLRASTDKLICIAITSCGRPEDRTRSLAAGIVLHLLKPAQPDALVATLANLARAKYGELQPA
jgi:CheY-like chemotaxis protein